MKRKILLIDESLTVQKVVALTLDKSRYALYYAKSRHEALKQWSENPPELILVGDQVPDINASSFPKEMEVWLGKGVTVPPMILITSHEAREQKNYAGILKKPFAPSSLQSMVSECLAHASKSDSETSPDEFEDQRLQKIFNDTFADESSLVRETFRVDAEEVRAESFAIPGSTGNSDKNPWGDNAAKIWDAAADSGNQLVSDFPTHNADGDLWGSPSAPRKNDVKESPVVSSRAPEVNSAAAEQRIVEQLHGEDLHAIIDRVLSRIVPPIVEKLVQERLDKLLKAQEEFVELKQ